MSFETPESVAQVLVMFVDNMATSIAESAAQIAALARAVQGNHSAEHLVRDTRHALGFTQP